MKIQKIREGVAEKGKHIGKSFIEFGFTKEEMSKAYNQYKSAHDKEVEKVFALNLVNKAQQAQLLENVSKKIKVDSFVPKIGQGTIDQFQSVLIQQGYDIDFVVKKSNGNFQVYFKNEAPPKTLTEGKENSKEDKPVSSKRLGRPKKESVNAA